MRLFFLFSSLTPVYFILLVDLYVKLSINKYIYLFGHSLYVGYCGAWIDDEGHLADWLYAIICILLCVCRNEY